MVKSSKSKKHRNRKNKGARKNPVKPRNINASTAYDTCTEQLSPFGGVLPLIKFFDLIGFRESFDSAYKPPSRKPKLGHYKMVVGVLMLLFIGFNRIWHFSYLRLDAMLCGFFQLPRLPVASTFWRYVNSLGLNQANALVNLMALIRKRAWQLCEMSYTRVCVDIDTTVETLFGNQQGGRKGHNTKNRGKKGYRPVLGFIQQTREYLVGSLRKGETITGKETARMIEKIRGCLPDCVQQVLIRADGEFQSWESVHACNQAKFDFIIANKRCNPAFDPAGWYQPKKRQPYQYNSCMYQPQGWQTPCRFVAMRIPIESTVAPDQGVQLALFEDERYKYRIFCTNLRRKAHEVIREYDKRADVENLVGEAKREGLVDSAPPITTVDYDGSWYNEDIVITVSATDHGSPPFDLPSGVGTIYYSIDGHLESGRGNQLTIEAIEAPADHSNDGIHTFGTFAADYCENRGAPVISEVKIDTAEPSTEIVITGSYPATVVCPSDPGGDFVCPDRGCYDEKVTVTLTATDDESYASDVSGVRSTAYNYDRFPFEAYTGPFEVSGFCGAHVEQLDYLSIDRAGNREETNRISFCITSDNCLSDMGLFNEEVRILAALEEIVAFRMRKDFASTLPPIQSVVYEYAINNDKPNWQLIGTDVNGKDGWGVNWNTKLVPNDQYLIRLTVMATRLCKRQAVQKQLKQLPSSPSSFERNCVPLFQTGLNPIISLNLADRGR